MSEFTTAGFGTPFAAGPPAGGLVLDDLLARLVELGGSDLHLTVGAPPTVRLRGEMVPVEGQAPLTALQIRDALYAALTERQRKAFEENLELDFAYQLPG